MHRFTLTTILAVAVAALTEGLLAPSVRFAILAITMIWFIPAGYANDALWPLRKRLWTTGAVAVCQDGSKEREPLVWSRDPVPPATDVSHLLD